MISHLEVVRHWTLVASAHCAVRGCAFVQASDETLPRYGHSRYTIYIHLCIRVRTEHIASIPLNACPMEPSLSWNFWWRQPLERFISRRIVRGMGHPEHLDMPFHSIVSVVHFDQLFGVFTRSDLLLSQPRQCHLHTWVARSFNKSLQDVTRLPRLNAVPANVVSVLRAFRLESELGKARIPTHYSVCPTLRMRGSCAQ